MKKDRADLDALIKPPNKMKSTDRFQSLLCNPESAVLILSSFFLLQNNQFRFSYYAALNTGEFFHSNSEAIFIPYTGCSGKNVLSKFTATPPSPTSL